MADQMLKFPVTFSGTDASGAPVSLAGTATIDGTNLAAYVANILKAPQLGPITGTIPALNVGTEFSTTLSMTNGTAPYRWDISGLPPGLSYASGTPSVSISGTPTTVGTYSVTIGCIDIAGQEQSEVIFVTVSPAVVIVPPGPAPTNVAATPWPTQVLVSFSPPALVAGKTIVSYTVTGVNAAWLTATGPSSPVMTQGGWSVGSTNDFTVHANYSDGSKSPESDASNRVAPLLIPGTPSTTPYILYQGEYYWGADYPFGTSVLENFADAAFPGPDGKPSYGLYLTITGGFQPAAPTNNYDLTGKTYLEFSWRPDLANDPLTITCEATGDVIIGQAVTINDATYGPAPQPGVWGTYKVPLTAWGLGSSMYKWSFQWKSQPAGSTGRWNRLSGLVFA